MFALTACLGSFGGIELALLKNPTALPGRIVEEVLLFFRRDPRRIQSLAISQPRGGNNGSHDDHARAF